MNTQHRAASMAKLRYQADPATAMRIINRLTPFNADELLKIELPIRMSFQALRSGTGTESDFHDIAAAINATMVRSEDVDPLCVQTATMARDALMRTWHRFERIGKFGFDGPALQQIEAGIDLHEQLVRLSTPLQMIEAMRTVIARGKSGEVAA